MLGGISQSSILIFSALFLLFVFSQKLPLWFHPAIGFGFLGYGLSQIPFFHGIANHLEWFQLFKNPWVWAVILFFYARAFVLNAVPHLSKNILKSFFIYAALATLVLPVSLWGVQWLVLHFLPAKYFVWPLLNNKELILLGLLSLPVAHALYVRPAKQVLGPVATQLKYLTLLSEIIFLMGFTVFFSFQNLAWLPLLVQFVSIAALLAFLYAFQRWVIGSSTNLFYEMGLVCFVLALAEILKLPLPVVGIFSGLLLANISHTKINYPEGILYFEALLLFMGGFLLKITLHDLPVLVFLILLLVALRWLLMFLAFKLAGTSRTLQVHGAVGWCYFSAVSLLPIFWLQGVAGFNLSLFGEFLILGILFTQILSWLVLRLNFYTAGEIATAVGK